MDRRKFIRSALVAGGGMAVGFPVKGLMSQEPRKDLVIVRNGSPSAMVRKAVDLLGGMKKFVASGNTVVVKPNIGWDRAPEYAANTNPEVAAEVVKMCFEAGAEKVISFDRTCNEARRCYINSGLEKAMSDAGARVRFIRDRLFEKVEIPGGFAINEWEFYRDVLEADVLINLPILKHHSISRLTIGLKNMMGVIGGNRGRIHLSFDQKIADINRIVRPQLTIVDAVRVLRRGGPSSGSLKNVERFDTIIAGTDPVLADAWGAELMGIDPLDLGWLGYAEQAGLGTRDIVNNLPLEYTFN